MTHWKKLIAILLVLTVSLSLTACSGLGTKAAKAALKMQKLNSLRTDLDVDFGMSVSMFGESMDLNMDLNGTVDLNTSPIRGKADMNVSMENTTEKILIYFEKEGSSLILYTSPDGGNTWTKTEADASEGSKISISKESLAALIQLGKSFEATGTETVRGSEAVVYSGILHWADFITDDMQARFLKAIEDEMGKALETEVDLSEVDLRELGDIPLTLCLDKKSSMPVKFSADLTETVRNIMPVILNVVMKSVVNQSGLGAIAGLGGIDLGMLGVDFDVRELVVTAELYDFDAVGEITIPAEAQAA